MIIFSRLEGSLYLLPYTHSHFASQCARFDENSQPAKRSILCRPYRAGLILFLARDLHHIALMTASARGCHCSHPHLLRTLTRTFLTVLSNLGTAMPYIRLSHLVRERSRQLCSLETIPCTVVDAGRRSASENLIHPHSIPNLLRCVTNPRMP